MLRQLISVSLFCGAFSAQAADPKVDLAEQFVRLLRYSDQYIDYRRACVTTGSSVSPESLVRDNPNRFDGVRPGMKQWPEVVEAYNKYFEEMCARPTEQEFLSALASSYAAELSEKDLKAAITFYSGPVGKKLIAAHRRAATNVYAEWTRINSAAMPVADANYSRRLHEIAKRAGTR